MLQNLVADYASKAQHGTEIDLAGLARNAEFRKEAVSEVAKYLEKHPTGCVLLPSYGVKTNRNPHLAQLTNELASAITKGTLVTGSVEEIVKLHQQPVDVLIIKQAFRTGEHLEKDVEALQARGYQVSVICLVTHSSGRVQAFAHNHGITVTTLAKVDEIRYLQ